MLEHLHHILAGIGLALVGIGAAFACRPAAQPALPAPIPAAARAAADPLPAAVAIGDGLTARGCAELVGHEAIVCEAYKDSEGIWTWGIGVTDASGHLVQRYIDKPQPVSLCLMIFIWLLRTKYLPAVRRAFAGHDLTEAQLHAALSFHYNTGQIGKALWVQQWKNGHVAEARVNFMNYRKPASIIERREKERDLFFDGTWSNDGMACIIPVRKPSYQPDFRNSHRVDITADLKGLLG